MPMRWNTALTAFLNAALNYTDAGIKQHQASPEGHNGATRNY